MRAGRWIGLHAATLAGIGLLIGPAYALWDTTKLPGWTWIHALITWTSVAFMQTRAVDRFPVSFRLWGPAVTAGYLLAYAAADSTFHACFSGLAAWAQARDWSPSAVSFSIALVSYGCVFPLPEGAVLYGKLRHGSVRTWVAAVGVAQLLMAPVGIFENFMAAAWKTEPFGVSLFLVAAGALHGLILGLATLWPLRRILAERKDPAA